LKGGGSNKYVPAKSGGGLYGFFLKERFFVFHRLPQAMLLQKEPAKGRSRKVVVKKKRLH